jgi:regulator of sirC expression with transglutaminase-like and TPR domain
MAPNVTYLCPTCDNRIHLHLQQCPHCKADLTQIAEAGEAADVCFNVGLDAARRQQWADALCSLALVLHYRPEDAGAWVLAGKVYARLEAKDRARSCFAAALRHAPHDEKAQAALEAVGGDPSPRNTLRGFQA